MLFINESRVVLRCASTKASVTKKEGIATGEGVQSNFVKKAALKGPTRTLDGVRVTVFHKISQRRDEGLLGEQTEALSTFAAQILQHEHLDVNLECATSKPINGVYKTPQR